MATQNYFINRGQIGNTPALSSRADEVFMDYVAGARDLLMHNRYTTVRELGDKALEENCGKEAPTPEDVGIIRAMIREVPEVGIYHRAKRTLQEAYWKRIIDSYTLREDELLAKLDEADKSGPGSVSWDPNFSYPRYATVDIHIQPGGYVSHPLAGMHYDYGTRVFFSGEDGDTGHLDLVSKTSLPKDGKVERVMDLGCSIGQFTCALKQRFSEAEVWGTDIASPMVRYGHLRAIAQDLDVHFAQMASEDLNFPDDHFDLVTAHILFHELPMEVIHETIKETFRVLRPGGNFVIWDFTSSARGDKRFGGFGRIMDMVDNGEPYSWNFINCDVEAIMAKHGFVLRYTKLDDLERHGRVGDKPS